MLSLVDRSHSKIVALILVMIAASWCGPIFAQTPLGNVILRPLLDPRPDTTTFEIWLKKLDPQWDFVANGTFRIEVPSLSLTGGIDPAVHTFSYENPSSQLTPMGPYLVSNSSVYHLEPEVFAQRMSVMLLCPDSVSDCVRIANVGDSVLIGRFTLSTNDGSFLSDTVTFISDERQLAMAFKADHDSVTGVGLTRNVWYVKHDNVPFGSNVQYISEPPPPDSCNGVFDFRGVYIGDLQVELGFDVTDEHCYIGYWIEKSLVNQRDPTVLNFQPIPRLNYNVDASLKSCRCLRPQSRNGYLDSVQFRREQYAYRLMGEFQSYYSGDTVAIDTIFIRVPNAIISNAVLLENPFSNGTAVRFNIDDRVRLTGSVFDLGGRLIANLVDEAGRPIIDKEYPKGVAYRAYFKAPAVASQGLYNIVLIAIPINDVSIQEQSRVVLKGQLIR